MISASISTHRVFAAFKHLKRKSFIFSLFASSSVGDSAATENAFCFVFVSGQCSTADVTFATGLGD